MVPDPFLQDLFLQSKQDLGFQARSQVQVPFWSYFEVTCVTSLCKLQVLVPLASLFQQFFIFRAENDEDSLRVCWTGKLQTAEIQWFPAKSEPFLTMILGVPNFEMCSLWCTNCSSTDLGFTLCLMFA